jgi:hypothetical protein
VAPDVAEARRTQQSVTDGMSQDIAVGMATRAFVEGNLYPAHYQLASFLQPVEVIADSDAGP